MGKGVPSCPLLWGIMGNGIPLPHTCWGITGEGAQQTHGTYGFSHPAHGASWKMEFASPPTHQLPLASAKHAGNGVPRQFGHGALG